ncbi:MAG: hypothetical protein WC373_02655 [Smithella sp.]|jgi:hypothetical protein
MFRLIKVLTVMSVLFFIVVEPAKAEWCLNYSSTVIKNHPGNTYGCVSTREACLAEQNNSAHGAYYSGSCWERGGGSASSGFSSGKGKKGSANAAVKQALVEGIVGGILGAALNPSAPKITKSKTQPSAEAIAQQQKYKQQKQAQEAAQQAAFSANQRQLLSDLKGDVILSKPNAIDIKLPPESSAAGQIGLLEREGRQAVSKGKRSDWENKPKNLPAAAIPSVPEVPQPVPVEDDINANNAREALKNILSRINESHHKIEKIDREVKQLEETVHQEEQKAVTEKKPDDDSLRKAREALQRAKENREKTTAELHRLEEQEAAARSAMESATAAQQ